MSKVKDFQLKPIRYEDLKTVLRWRNSKRIRSFMYTDHPISLEEHENWYNNMKQDDSTIVLLLFQKDRPLGLVNFSKISKEDSRCYWGFYIGEETAPKGSGTIMGILALDKIFNEVGVRKVCAEVIETNIGSFHYHKKLGFETEGRFVKHVWKDNGYLDVIPMALFANKWATVRRQLLADLGDETP